MKRFWRWLCRFAYRRWALPFTQKPCGVPFCRDPDSVCIYYEPRPLLLGDWNDCGSDGHYLCAECCHLDPRKRFGGDAA